MGEAKRRKLLAAIGAEASGGTGTGVYTVTKYDQDTVMRLFAAAMTGDNRAVTRVTAMVGLIAQTAEPGVRGSTLKPSKILIQWV